MHICTFLQVYLVLIAREGGQDLYWELALPQFFFAFL